MIHTYTFERFPYTQSEEQRAGTIRRHPVVIVGAGPVGLTMAIDLALKGIASVVCDDNDQVSYGSRAVCYAKRPLEIWDRLGCGERMIEKGVVWKQGKVFRENELVFEFDLLPEDQHKIPAFINLQQYYLEEYLVDRARSFPHLIELRWKSRVVGASDQGDFVSLLVETPDGTYPVEADWLLACDGANSSVRQMLDLPFSGQVFQDRFQITDVVMKADFPPERWFWFDPPFHPGQSALLHMQPDDVWRIDFQLGWDADPETETSDAVLMPRLRAMLGAEATFELEWQSVYQFACRRMDRFRHNRVIFAGDAAHQVSPFGARGANTGVQDVDNLAWKLKLVMDGTAPDRLLDSYDEERVFAADDNLLNSTRATDFITPKTGISRAFRDAVLDLARDHAFARPMINSGRLSRPTVYAQSSLNTPDAELFEGAMTPGTNCVDAPVNSGEWLLNHLGNRFVALTFDADPGVSTLDVDGVGVEVLVVAKDLSDPKGTLAARYDMRPGTTYLIRPDQYVAARWRHFDRDAIAAAVNRATARA